MIAYRPTPDLDDDLCFVPALDGSDDYEPEPLVIDETVMLITGDPIAIEPQYGTVPCIVTGTGLKEWY